MKKLLLSISTLSLLVFTACGASGDEQQRYIDASIEATCMIFQSDDVFDPALQDEVKEVYDNYGFDADDEAAMEALNAKYENNTVVRDAITGGVEGCIGSVADLFGDIELDVEGEEDVTVEGEEDGEEEPAE